MTAYLKIFVPLNSYTVFGSVLRGRQSSSIVVFVHEKAPNSFLDRLRYCVVKVFVVRAEKTLTREVGTPKNRLRFGR